MVRPTKKLVFLILLIGSLLATVAVLYLDRRTREHDMKNMEIFIQHLREELDERMREEERERRI